MKKEIEKSAYEVFYKIAISIGKSLELHKMLLQALKVYCELLNCKYALVVEMDKPDSTTLNPELTFTVPLTLGIKDIFTKIESILPKYTSIEEFNNYNTSLPIKGILNSNLFYQIFKLKDFGHLVIIKENTPLDDKLIPPLQELHNSLAHACLACEKSSDLLASEKRYRDLSELLPEMICETDLQGKLTFINSYALDKMGYTKQDIESGFNIFTIFSKEDIPRAQKNFSQNIVSKNQTPNEYIVYKKDGDTLPVLIYTNQIIKDKKAVGLRGVMVDITERNKNELQIKQNTERLELALKGSNSGLWDWNLETDDFYSNLRWFTMRGYDPYELGSRLNDWKNTIHPDDIEIPKKMMESYFKGKSKLYSAEYRIISKQGEVIWVLDTGKVTEYTNDSKPQRIVGTCIDITSNKTNELSLTKNLKQQELLSSIALETNSMQNLPDTIQSVITKIGKHSNVSRVYIFEDHPAKNTTSNTFEWCNDGVNSQISELQNIPYSIIPSWKKFLKEEGLIYSENICELPNDLVKILAPQNIKSILVFPLTTRNKIFGFIGFDECKVPICWSKSEIELLRTVANIISTSYERKFSENTILQREEETRLILESIPDTLFIIDTEGCIVSYRTKSEEELAFPPEEYIGKKIEDIFPENQASKFNKALQDCLKKGKAKFDYELVIDDSPIDFEVNLARTINNQIIALVRNISERKQYEKQLKDERDKAEYANRAKSEFLANMSHELRTPMNAILGFSESLQESVSTAKNRYMAESVHKSGKLLLSLLNDILDLSKLESDRIKINPTPVHIEGLINEVMLTYNSKAIEKNITLKFIPNTSIPDSLMLDAIRIKQILINLIGNAIKFTSQGFVEISIDFKSEKAKRDTLTLTIKDTGIGIKESDKEQIFEAFKQLSGTASRKKGGTGLGLALTQRLIKKMDGTIHVESEVNKGSSFTVEIPAKIATISAQSKKTEPSDNYDLSKNKILIVDDTPLNTMVLKTMLEPTKCNILSSEIGEEALRVIKKHRPNLIFLDLHLPDIDGKEVAKIVKADKTLNHITLIAFSASDEAVNDQELMQYFDGFLAKPISQKKLFEIINQNISVKKEEPAEQDIHIPEVLPHNIAANIASIMAIINSDIIPFWNEIKDYLVIYQIEEFVEKLEELFFPYDCSYINKYINELKEALNNFNLKSIKEKLIKFEEIITYLKKFS